MVGKIGIPVYVGFVQDCFVRKGKDSKEAARNARDMCSANHTPFLIAILTGVQATITTARAYTEKTFYMTHNMAYNIMFSEISTSKIYALLNSVSVYGNVQFTVTVIQKQTSKKDLNYT